MKNTMNATISSASSFAQDVQIDLSNLKDLFFVYQEFADSEKRDLSCSSSASNFLSRYGLQEALQNAVDNSIQRIASDVDKLVDMLMEIERNSRTEKEA